MNRRLAVVPLLLGTVALAGANHLRLHADTDTRPRLTDWTEPGFIAQSDRSMFHVATLCGYAGGDYAHTFAFYAQKVGGTSDDMASLTTFQKPNHSLISSLSTDMDTNTACYIGADTLYATFCRHRPDGTVTVSLFRTRRDPVTYVTLSATTP